MRLFCYVDATFNSYKNAKSHYGYSFSLGENNGHFFSKSAKMKIVTLSSTESEYVALCFAVLEIVYLRRILAELGFPQSGPTVVYEDNQSCIKIVEGSLNHNTTKHINVKYHYSRQQFKKGTFTIEHIATEEMIADILTKSLSANQNKYLSKKMLRGY